MNNLCFKKDEVYLKVPQNMLESLQIELDQVIVLATLLDKDISITNIKHNTAFLIELYIEPIYLTIRSLHNNIYHVELFIVNPDDNNFNTTFITIYEYGNNNPNKINTTTHDDPFTTILDSLIFIKNYL